MTFRHTSAPRGEAHYASKLTADDVRLIRQCAEERARLRAQADELSNRRLAEKFSVARQTIERIISRERWSTL